MAFTIFIDLRAIRDIQEAIDYYEGQQLGLVQRFEGELNQHILSLEKNPFFRIRYDNVHCMPLKQFPFMVHFTVDEDQQVVTIRALFHTSLDPKKWKGMK